MKRLSLVLLSFFAFVIIRAQEAIKIGEGTKLHYSIMPNGGYVTASLFVEKLNADTLLFSWQLNARSGRRGMLKKSIETARKGYWEPPMDGEDFMIPEDQSLLSLSRICFNELKQRGRMEFDGMVFTTKDSNAITYDMNGTKIRALSATSENGYTRIWVMDDPAFPLILKLDGNPFQVDVELTSIN